MIKKEEPKARNYFLKAILFGHFALLVLALMLFL